MSHLSALGGSVYFIAGRSRDGSKPRLAGLLNRKNFLSNSLRKIDEGELSFVEEVVVPALVDDAHEIVLGRSRVGDNSIDLPRISEASFPVFFRHSANCFVRRFMRYPGTP